METNPLKIDDWVHSFWKKNKVRQKVLALRKGKKKFYFLDGPPYATGYVHIGTARNKTIKDYYLRYNRMKGFDVWAQPGYDTHGLPIESKVEKKLGIKSKQDIEKMGVANFNKECAAFATQFVDFMAKAFMDLGIWYDWEHPYYTYSNDYINGAWYTLKIAYDKGLLYKGKYPVHICPHCETASAFYEINYKNIDEESIIVKFPIKENEFLLIFTTTPWTLPANTGVMVNPDGTYVRAKFGDEIWICSEDTIVSIAKAIGRDYAVLESFAGKKLIGLEYQGPFGDLPLQKNIKPRIVPSARYVNTKEGTGLVHCAPGHGQEDYQVGTEFGLPLLSPVGLDGKYTNDVGKYSGLFVKDADSEIIKDLETRGLLAKKVSIKHDYPFCWRCDSALLFASVPQWFFKVKDFKDKLLALNEQIRWVPDWGKKRFYDWLTNISDWPISRQRYWGIPIPIWSCEKCSELRVIGSIYDLPKKLKDVHKPFIDKITLKCVCGGVMHRVPDVLDVWFDSGVASWASINYPKKKEPFQSMWPPEFNTEGTDQFRGWWNSQLITSYVTFGNKLPYKTIRVHGMTWDKTGHPMSKSRGNFVEPHEIFSKHGRDALRFYLPYDDPSAEFYFDWEGRGKQLMRFFNTFFNIVTYIETAGGKPAKPRKLNAEDLWIMSKVNTLLKKITELNDNYLEYVAIQSIDCFVTEEFSRFYIKLIRDRVSAGDTAAIYSLYYVLDRVVKMLAPLIPFSTEYVYQNMLKEKGVLSVHMCDWPEADEKQIDTKLEAEVGTLKEIVSTILALREKLQRSIRWPVKAAIIVTEDHDVKSAAQNQEGLIKLLANVLSIEAKHKLEGIKHTVKPDYSRLAPRYKGDSAEIIAKVAMVSPESILQKIRRGQPVIVKYSKGDAELREDDFIIEERLPEGLVGQMAGNYSIYLETAETKEMLASGFARELTRAVQDLRKTAGLSKPDKIRLIVAADKETEGLLKEHTKEIKEKVGAASMEFVMSVEKARHRNQVKIRNKTIVFGF